MNNPDALTVAPPSAARSARMATAIGIPVYAALGALGMWAGAAAWDALATPVVADPTLLAGPKVATAVVSVLIAVLGVPAVAFGLATSLARACAAPAPPVGSFALVGGGIALVPAVLVTLGSGHAGPAIALTLVALVVPAALTGAITAALLPSVSRSRPLAVGFGVAAVIAVIIVVVWAAFAFTPLGG
jgi:hypothetical protein